MNFTNLVLVVTELGYVCICTMRVNFEANEGIYSIKYGYCIYVNTETKLLKLR